jgi:hypothetical protein
MTPGERDRINHECACNFANYEITWCPLHLHAPDLLAALKQAKWFLMTKARRDPGGRNIVAVIVDAIKATEGANNDAIVT